MYPNAYQGLAGFLGSAAMQPQEIAYGLYPGSPGADPADRIDSSFLLPKPVCCLTGRLPPCDPVEISPLRLRGCCPPEAIPIDSALNDDTIGLGCPGPSSQTWKDCLDRRTSRLGNVLL